MICDMITRFPKGNGLVDTDRLDTATLPDSGVVPKSAWLEAVAIVILYFNLQRIRGGCDKGESNGVEQHYFKR